MSIYYRQITVHITAAAVPLILHKNFAQIISEFLFFLDPGAIDIQYREYFLHQIMSRRGRVEACLWIRKPQILVSHFSSSLLRNSCDCDTEINCQRNGLPPALPYALCAFFDFVAGITTYYVTMNILLPPHLPCDPRCILRVRWRQARNFQSPKRS